MSCKYFCGTIRPSCLASEKLMVPSIYETTRFCLGQYEECLIFQEKEKILSRKDAARPKEETQKQTA